MLSPARMVASLALLLLLAVYVLLMPPTRAGTVALEACPMELAGLPGLELSVDETVLDDLNPDAILTRAYRRADGRPVWLTIVYFENARLGLHDPHLCYRSQGFAVEILPEERLATSLGTIPLQTFRAVRGQRRERVQYFWYTAGGRAIGEVKAFRDRMFWQGLRSNRSFGAFVRVSTLEDEGDATAGELLERFVRELAPILPRLIPET